MDPNTDSLHEALKNIRDLPTELLLQEYQARIPAELAPAQQFWSGYDEKQTYVGLRSSEWNILGYTNQKQRKNPEHSLQSLTPIQSLIPIHHHLLKDFK
ncbi:hypothetical protein CPB84DRAFT_1780945 [Gymnopilus junonius]|uniref:Uncharacterized protein n=1 Tax=Gymnopilus junonius TaxID=109634 RepID=A0A9P5TLE5_GYMJU|nr:hypothetical protein CPB84DRAFT_1780945 [Gymnopilus junonius]